MIQKPADLIIAAKNDEETYVWYARQDCEIKGFQWLMLAREQFVMALEYSLGSLNGVESAEVERKLRAAYEAYYESGEDYPE